MSVNRRNETHISVHQALDVKIERPWLMSDKKTWTSGFTVTDVKGNIFTIDLFAPTQEALVPRVTGLKP